MTVRSNIIARRPVLAGIAATVTGIPGHAGDGAAVFLAEAQRMRDAAVAAGDQAYGAVLVLDGKIVGWGPSRVVVDRNVDAHAERVAITDAQSRLGRSMLTGATLYSTSRPCRACEAAASRAGVERMVFGEGQNAGRPRP